LTGINLDAEINVKTLASFRIPESIKIPWHHFGCLGIILDDKVLRSFSEQF
jgi:hypothetical protein